MRKWLERAIPEGRWHDWLVDVADAAFMLGGLLLTFIIVRWLALRALAAITRPIVARAEHEGGTGGARVKTLEGLARSVVNYLLVFLAVVTMLSQIGINISAILAGAGVVGLALSFGAQRLVRDVISGAFLLAEDQFRVGEAVTLMCASDLPPLDGTVMEMGLRVTRLQDLSGKLITLANGEILAVVNHNRGTPTASVDIGLAADTPLDQVREVIASVALPETLFTGCAAVEGVADLDADRMVVRITAPAVPGRVPEAEMGLREAAALALHRADLTIR
jgi:moderate conductance mechanosensitive channel